MEGGFLLSFLGGSLPAAVHETGVESAVKQVLGGREQLLELWRPKQVQTLS